MARRTAPSPDRPPIDDLAVDGHASERYQMLVGFAGGLTHDAEHDQAYTPQETLRGSVHDQIDALLV
jgi:hypothetical protein